MSDKDNSLALTPYVWDETPDLEGLWFPNDIEVRSALCLSTSIPGKFGGAPRTLNSVLQVTIFRLCGCAALQS